MEPALVEAFPLALDNLLRVKEDIHEQVKDRYQPVLESALKKAC